MSESPIFQVRGLRKSYGRNRVLEGVDFDLGRRECLVVLGRSGIGKSVLLRQLIGLEQPQAGSILFDGSEIVGLDESHALTEELPVAGQPGRVDRHHYHGQRRRTRREVRS